MEILLFTATAMALYVISDSILKAIEKKQGKLLPNRSVIFFIIIAVLSTITFELMQTFGPELGLLPDSATQEPASPTPSQTQKP